MRLRLALGRLLALIALRLLEPHDEFWDAARSHQIDELAARLDEEA